jgi:D-glycero-D-manno-heptose 1,7-bisphosphate phosphatase
MPTHLARPTQAVILAGGRGTRMRPLTDTKPKAMIPFHGKPFLEYVIDLLRDQGFERVLLLLGYLPEVIQDHFGDGRRFGVDIAYSVSGADDLTVKRLQLAEHRLDPLFLLLYCDNYWPLQMNRLWDDFAADPVPAMVTVYSNRDGYSRDSVLVDDRGYIRVFDRTRATPGLAGVEISYALIQKPVVTALLGQADALFEEAAYSPLAAAGQLRGHVTHHRYYSVGSMARLPLTEAFFARRPTVLLDRDGVINKKPPRAAYVRSQAEFEWLPGAREALRDLHAAGIQTIVISNQAGVARGAMSDRALEDLHGWMRREIEAAGGRLDAIYCCPHAWDAGCECRKPRPGLFFQAQRDFSLDLTRTCFIGDDDRDAEAAVAAGCSFARVSSDVSLLDVTRDIVNRAGGVLA